METCGSCGRALRPELLFCPGCGSPVAAASSTAPPSELLSALDRALEGYSRLLEDLQNGAVQPEEFQKKAVGTGVVRWQEEVWILDLKGGRWWRYDGLGLNPVIGRDLPHAHEPETLGEM